MQRRQCLQLFGGSLGSAAFLRVSAKEDDARQAVGQLAAWTRGATPALKAQTLDARTVNLSDFAGAPLIINFWASYCGPCRLEMPMFNALLEQHRAHGLRVLAVNHGEMPARVTQFLKDVPVKGDVLLDRSQTQLSAWGGYALPSSYVLDANGRVHWWHMGELDWMSDAVQHKLQAVMAISRKG